MKRLVKRLRHYVQRAPFTRYAPTGEVLVQSRRWTLVIGKHAYMRSVGFHFVRMEQL